MTGALGYRWIIMYAWSEHWRERRARIGIVQFPSVRALD